MYMGLFLQSLSDFPEINSMTNEKKQGERNFSSRMNKNCNQTGKKNRNEVNIEKKRLTVKHQVWYIYDHTHMKTNVHKDVAWKEGHDDAICEVTRTIRFVQLSNLLLCQWCWWLNEIHLMNVTD